MALSEEEAKLKKLMEAAWEHGPIYNRFKPNRFARPDKETGKMKGPGYVITTAEKVKDKK